MHIIVESYIKPRADANQTSPSKINTGRTQGGGIRYSRYRRPSCEPHSAKSVHVPARHELMMPAWLDHVESDDDVVWQVVDE
jgi:hypothetical protein